MGENNNHQIKYSKEFLIMCLTLHTSCSVCHPQKNGPHKKDTHCINNVYPSNIVFKYLALIEKQPVFHFSAFVQLGMPFAFIVAVGGVLLINIVVASFQLFIDG